MATREATLAGDSVDGDNVDATIRKHEDLDRAVNAQEEKIASLQNFAEQLCTADHYDAPEIHAKRDEVLERLVINLARSLSLHNRNCPLQILYKTYYSPRKDTLRA
jgi:hypothetical protein